ncbi:MAG TPA: FecR family protein [Kofleriaceae bacterium]|nr:FecR family protein [Kofleriaceae bacterium]
MSEHDRLGPPPVEPLSDLAWSRIERGLWSRMDAAPPAERPARARARRWVWIAVPALAAAAAAVVLVPGLRGDAPPADAPARLVSGAAPTSLSYGDVHVTLDADSAAVMERAKGAVLERGAAWFTVAPRRERAAFVVTAGDTVVRVIGTKFRVARSGEEAAVQVERGIVEVLFRGATIRVGAGDEWTSRAPTRVTPTRVAEAEIELLPEPAPAPPAPAVNPKPPVQVARPVSGTRTPPVTAPAPARPDPAAAKYHRLEQLEVKNPRAAIDGYLELSRGSSRWAERALFAAARLAADKKQPRARALLEIYLTRFPSGANVGDARTLLDHIQGANR